MVNKKQITVGILIVLILTSAVYITFSDKIRMRVDNDQTTFYMPHETYSWIWTVVGREKNSIFDGTSKMNRNSSGIMVWTEINEDTKDVYIYRETNYLRGPKILDTYYFNGNVKNIELFPISHTIEIWNASGKFYRYEARDLIYDGPTEKLIGVTEKEFGRNMKIEWEPDYRWAWVYKDGILKVQYDIDSDYEKFNIRLFDPATVTLVVPVNDTYSLDLTQTFTCNYSADFGVTNLSLYIWNSTDDVIVLNSAFEGITASFQEFANITDTNDSEIWVYVNYTKPSDSINATWRGQMSYDGPVVNYTNITINSSSDCWTEDADELQLRFSSMDSKVSSPINCGWVTVPGTVTGCHLMQCYYSGAWNNLLNVSNGNTGSGLASPTPNVDVTVDGLYCSGLPCITEASTYGQTEGEWGRFTGSGVDIGFIEEAIFWGINNTLSEEESWNVTFTEYDNYTWNCLAT